MQFLLIDKNETLQSLSKIVGSQNIDLLLSENGLKRSPNIGQQWAQKCAECIQTTPNDITGSRKSALLNNLTGSEEAFEKACLLDEDEWKVMSAFQAFPDALRVPDSIQLPYSSRVMGDTLSNDAVISNVQASRTQTITNQQGQRKAAVTQSSDPVSPVTYKAVMTELKSGSTIDPGVLNSVNTSPSVSIDKDATFQGSANAQQAFNLPWGKIQLYSSLLDRVVDFPVYPEEVEESRVASYTAMPDLLYQYEPWIVYQSSGPREQSLDFHMHRDMWSGNHLDGKAAELINFCKANTFPRYSGSSVLPPRVRLYVNGSLFISGVLTATKVDWKGPIGQDDWYLEFILSLSIQEVSESPLNIDTVSQRGLIGS